MTDLEMRCTFCNWSAHKLGQHTDLCRNGHPRDVVGIYSNGGCRECQRDRVSLAKYGRVANRRYTAKSNAPSGAEPDGSPVAGTDAGGLGLPRAYQNYRPDVAPSETVEVVVGHVPPFSDIEKGERP